MFNVPDPNSGGIPLILPAATTQYRMVKISIDWKQVTQTYLAVYGVILLILCLLWFFLIKPNI